jgi:hypothetical protein
MSDFRILNRSTGAAPGLWLARAPGALPGDGLYLVGGRNGCAAAAPRRSLTINFRPGAALVIPIVHRAPVSMSHLRVRYCVKPDRGQP